MVSRIAFGLCICCLVSEVSWAQNPPNTREGAIAAIETAGGKVYSNADDQIDMIAMTGANFSDKDLELLQHFPQVRSLDLNDSRVTTAGLETLLKFRSLEEVSLKRTGISAPEAEAFKTRHPGVYFVEVSPGFQLQGLLIAGLMLVPLSWGVGLIWLTRHRQAKLPARIYARGILWGILLIAGSVVIMIIAIFKASGLGQ